MLVIYTPKPISARWHLSWKTRALQHRGEEQLSPWLHQRAWMVGWCSVSVVRAACCWGVFLSLQVKGQALGDSFPPLPDHPTLLAPAGSLEPQGLVTVGSKLLQPLHLLSFLSSCSKLMGSTPWESLEHLVGFPLGPWGCSVRAPLGRAASPLPCRRYLLVFHSSQSSWWWLDRTGEFACGYRRPKTAKMPSPSPMGLVWWQQCLAGRWDSAPAAPQQLHQLLGSHQYPLNVTHECCRPREQPAGKSPCTGLPCSPHCTHLPGYLVTAQLPGPAPQMLLFSLALSSAATSAAMQLLAWFCHSPGTSHHWDWVAVAFPVPPHFSPSHPPSARWSVLLLPDCHAACADEFPILPPPPSEFNACLPSRCWVCVCASGLGGIGFVLMWKRCVSAKQSKCLLWGRRLLAVSSMRILLKVWSELEPSLAWPQQVHLKSIGHFVTF